MSREVAFFTEYEFFEKSELEIIAVAIVAVNFMAIRN